MLGGWVKKVKDLDTEHICITYRHRQQCGDGQRDCWVRAVEGMGKDGEIEDTCNNVNNTSRVKRKEQQF